MDKYKLLTEGNYDSNSSDSSDSSKSSDATHVSSQSIIWIGPKLKPSGSTASEDTTDTTDTTTEESDITDSILTAELSDDSDAPETLRRELPNKLDICRSDIESSDSDASESTQVPESSNSTMRSEFSESTISDDKHTSNNNSTDTESDISSDSNSDSNIDTDVDGVSDRTYTGRSSKSALSVSCSRKLPLTACKEMTQFFTDAEFQSGKLKVKVPQESLFTYLKVDQTKVFLVDMPMKTKLEHIIDDMVENNKGAYMRIEIGTKVFECIPSLLRVYSLWFANQKWNANNFVFNEKDVPSSAFKIIYKWVRDKTTVKQKHALKVMQAAKYLKIDLLVKECWKLVSKPNIREKLAFEVYLRAAKYSELEDIREIMLNRIRLYFIPMVGTEDFANMPLEQLIRFIELDTIGVNTEVEVFFAIIHWISRDPNDRLQHMQLLMEYVRFPYLSMTTLFSLRNEKPVKEFPDIRCADYVLMKFTNDPIMRKKIYATMSFISLRMQSDTEQEKNNTIPKEFRSPRRWIYNPKCLYHLSRLDYPYKHNVMFDNFMEFVNASQADWIGDQPTVSHVQIVEFDGYRRGDIDPGDMADEE